MPQAALDHAIECGLVFLGKDDAGAPRWRLTKKPTPTTRTRATPATQEKGWAEARARRHGVRWFPDEDEALRTSWSTATVEELAKKHERDTFGIICRAKLIGILPTNEGEPLLPSGKSVVHQRGKDVLDSQA